MTITLGTTLKVVSNGDSAKVIKVDDRSKTAIIELTDGSTKNYSFSTLKDKRRFLITDVEEPEVVEEPEEEMVSAEDLEPAMMSEAHEEAEPVKSKIRKSLRLKEVTYKGETKSIREWAEETGMPWKTLYNRINNNGWQVELAIETPLGGRKPKSI